MRILIVEDEALVATRLTRLTQQVLGERLHSLVVRPTLESATAHLHDNPVDLLLLDLNLNGQNGFELLQHAVAGSFHTLVVSAYTDRAIEAFEYGVLDFVAKPFSAERLQKAFDRFERAEPHGGPALKYLSVRSHNKLRLIDIRDVLYIRGAGVYSELHLRNGSTALHDKPLHRLLDLLPSSYVRVHRSFIVSLPEVKHLDLCGAGKYQLVLHSGATLPLSREKYKEFREFK